MYVKKRFKSGKSQKKRLHPLRPVHPVHRAERDMTDRMEKLSRTRMQVVFLSIAIHSNTISSLILLFCGIKHGIGKVEYV